MGKHAPNDSLWRRGWQDTKAMWTSWQFFVLNAVVAVVIGGVFEWYWGLGVILFGMLCVWMGATAMAPVRQRNEARAVLLAKPKVVPLQNRDTLIRVIGNVKRSAIDLQRKADELNRKRKTYQNPQDELFERDKAFSALLDAQNNLDDETLVAGETFRPIINSLERFIDYHTYACMNIFIEYDGPKNLSTVEFMSQLSENIDKTIRELDALSQ